MKGDWGDLGRVKLGGQGGSDGVGGSILGVLLGG